MAILSVSRRFNDPRNQIQMPERANETLIGRVGDDASAAALDLDDNNPTVADNAHQS